MIHKLPIQFDEVQHRYTGLRKQRYISATQLVALVENPFDTEYHAQRMSREHGHTPEYWKDKWKQKNTHSLNRGNLLHKTKEDFSIYRGVERINGKEYRVHNQDRILQFTGPDYWYWPDGLYIELMLWNHRYRLAGKSDRTILWSDREGNRYADIEDHKTNESIKKVSWYDKETGYRMLKPPLDHLMDCELVKYTLQLSIYQFMLEEMGFTPGYRRLLHYEPLPIDLGEPGELSKIPTIHNLDYLREEVIILLKYGAKHQ